MKLLFMHQNFPGQYKLLSAFLAGNPKNQVVSLAERRKERTVNMPPIRHVLYDAPKGASPSTHQYVRALEATVRRGQAVVRACIELRREGFAPDVICAHAGWGEALYVKEIFPKAKLINYYEFFYNVRGADSGFDPEFPITFDDHFKIPTKNATHLLSFQTSDWGVTPTQWQRSQFPPLLRATMSVIHEGIDTRYLKPEPEPVLRIEKPALTFTRKDEVVTFVSRNLEPARGFHIFMRALPEILRRRPKAKVIIVGGDDVSYGRRLPEGETWRKKMMAEVGSSLDMQRVFFVGKLPYPTFIKMLQVSSAHVYLTIPFVLSWSMLEAMAVGALVVGSRTPPVQEVLDDGVNGLLVDFLSPQNIAERVDEALTDKARMAPLRQAARETVVKRFDFRTVCLPQHLALIESLTGMRQPAGV